MMYFTGTALLDEYQSIELPVRQDHRHCFVRLQPHQRAEYGN